MATAPPSGAARRSAITTARTSNAAAVRRIAPTLCGSLIWSSIRTRLRPGSGAQARRRSSLGRGATESARPWCTASAPSLAVDLGALDGQHLEAGTLGAGAEPGQHLGGREQPVAAALRVGERRLDRVPAVQPQAPGRRLGGLGAAVAVTAAFGPYHALLPLPRRGAAGGG